MRPSHPFHRLLALSFTVGPALLAAGALAFAFDIGLIPPGITSWVEGILASYGIILFVPIYLALAHHLSKTHPRLATVAALTGLFGAIAGFGHEYARVLEHDLRMHGAPDAVFASFAASPSPELLVVALLGPLFPLTSILLGAGFWRAGTLPRWVAAALVAAGIGFPLAQVVGWEWGLRLTYPGATLLWLVALSWVGRNVIAPQAALDPLPSTRYESLPSPGV